MLMEAATSAAVQNIDRLGALEVAELAAALNASAQRRYSRVLMHAVLQRNRTQEPPGGQLDFAAMVGAEKAEVAEELDDRSLWWAPETTKIDIMQN